MKFGEPGRFVVVRLVVALAFALFGTATLAAVLGDLKTGSAGTMTITLSGISFDTDPSSTPPGPPWNAEVANGTSVSFAGCASGVLGTAGCLSATEAIQVSPLTFATPVTSYLTFAAHPSVVYSLDGVGPSTANLNCAAATNIGGSCSIFAGSPFLLTTSATGTTITFVVFGKASDAGIGGLPAGLNYEGAFVGPVAGQTPRQIQLFFCPSGVCLPADFTSGRSLTTSQSGDFSIALAAGVDLAVTKTDGVTSAVPGSSTTYTIVVSDNGTVGVNGATVSDTFPAGITAVTWTCVASAGASCAASGVGNINDSVDLPSGGSVTYTAQASISPSATGSLTNTATVAAPVGVTDVNAANNTATDTDALTPQADLRVVKTGPPTVAIGALVTYTLAVTNNGPSDAQNVVLADTLSPGSIFVSQTQLSGPVFSLSNTTTSINDTITTLAAGASATVQVVATVPVSLSAGSPLTNTATVSAATADTNPANNASTSTSIASPSLTSIPTLSPAGLAVLALLLAAGAWPLLRRS